MLIALFKTLAITLVITFAIAAALIVSQRPTGTHTGEGGLDFTGRTAQPTVPNSSFTARDGTVIPLRKAGSGTDALVVLIHGSGWHSAQWDDLVTQLGAVAGITALAPDLRGHGLSPAARGDVAYVGQLEHDLDDLIAAHVQPGQRLVLVGHSSGGGLVIRHAGGRPAHPAHATVLVAPYLHFRAPTVRPNSGGWAQPLTRRIIGLVMLNAARIRALNGLTAIEFNIPDHVLARGGTGAYSYRMNTSYAPRNRWSDDVAALPATQVIVGEQDEAFVASAYADALTPLNSQIGVQIVPDRTHLSILNDPVLFTAITQAARPRS